MFKYHGRQFNRYLVEKDGQHHLVDLDEKTCKALTPYEAESLVKHGYWQNDIRLQDMRPVEDIVKNA